MHKLKNLACIEKVAKLGYRKCLRIYGHRPETNHQPFMLSS
jgi:hypothetical protein